MKKNTWVHLLLCFAILMQLLSVPASATETATVEPTSAQTQTQSDTFGTASVLNGCRTIDGQVPLGGSTVMLESAQAAFIYEQNTGTILYAYNPDITLSPGALVKIVSALVAIENGNLSDQVTISTANYDTLPAGAINVSLKNDEVLTLEDLLYCMIVGMANDAAITIAEHVAGSESAFVEKMNDLVKSIGCTSTLFTNCHGTNSSGQYTTARDIVRIVEYAMKNQTFAEIFGAESYTVPATTRSEERSLTTKNYLMEQLDVTKYIDYDVTGGIATYTSSSGASLACTASKNGLSLILVVLGCKREYNTTSGTVKYYGNFDEMEELISFAADGYKICRLLHEGQSWNQFTVADGENDVVGETQVGMDVVLPKTATTKNLIIKYTVKDGGLTAPIAKGEKIATMQLSYQSSCVAEAELFAMSEVRAVSDNALTIQDASRDDSNLQGVLQFIGVVCLIILIPFAVYMIVNNARRSIARNRRRRRRRSRRRSR